MRRYFPRLLTIAVPLKLNGSDVLASENIQSTAPSFGLDLLSFVLPVSIFSALLVLLIYLIRKFVLKKTSTWADLCWPTALANLLLLGGIGIFVISAFSGIFASFGAELPAPTLFIMAIPPFLWFLPFVAALFVKCIVFKGNACQARSTRVWVAIQLVALLLVAFLQWALYLPIFKIGTVV